MKELFLLLVFVILSVAFALCALVASFICAPKAPNKVKESTYECGVQLFSDARVQFDIKYFNYAILFLIFDIETIFLFPFALNFQHLQLFAIVESFIFIGLLLWALLYAIKSNLLRWL